MTERFQKWSKILNAFVLLIGTAVLLGWLLDVEMLKRPLPHLVAMNPATATAFIFSSLSFFLLTSGSETFLSKNSGATFGKLLAGLVLLIGILKLGGVLFGFDTRIDQIIFSKKLDTNLAGNISNRMAPNSAFCFILTGIGLLLLRFETSKNRMPAHYLALTTALVGLVSVIGYMYRVEAFYGILTYIPMAIHTAVSFMLISLAVLFANPRKGLMKEFTSPYVGSITARRLVPLAVLLPVVLGFLRLLGEWYHLFSTEFGVTILVLGIIISFLLLIRFNAAWLNKKDKAKQEAEEQIALSNNRFITIFNFSPIALCITGIEDGLFMYANDAFCQATGYKKEELVGKKSVELNIISEEERKKIINRIQQSGGHGKDIEIKIRKAEGEMIDAFFSVEKIEIDNKSCFITALVNITDRKKAEEEIKQLNENLEKNLHQLEAVNKELEAFSYSVSHDLRAPLRAINGYAGMIAEDYKTVLDEEGMRLLSVVKYNAKKMGTLIDDLLAFSRLGKKEVQKTNIDMNELAEGALLELNKSLEHKAEVKIGKLHPVQADYALFDQVFINLISNAIKYSSKKEKPVIEIKSEQKNGEVIYSVKDNGVGFNMKYVHKLFGVFQRLHTMEEFEGTGVGLAIVQRIVNKHGGKIWAEAKPNEGAIFYFSVPINQTN